MAFFAPLALNAQSRSTLTVYGDNTTTNEYVPIYGYWADSKSKCEFIIPKEKLSAMTGGRISAMKFYLSSSGTNNQISATFNVFVKEVSATTLTGFTGTGNATTVFNNTITIAANASNVEFDIPFSSDYIYNGGNLLVGFYQTGSTGYNHTYWTGEDQSTNTAWSGYGTQTGSGRQFLPKTTFTYEISTTPEIVLPGTATVLTGSTTTLTATTLNVTGTPSITYSSNNLSVATVSGSGTTATVTGVSAGTATITATMTYDNNTYNATCTITVEDPSYCTPAPSNVDNSGISNVAFAVDGTTILTNATTMSTSVATYLDCTNKIVSVEPGTTVGVNITYSTGYTYGTGIWVDLDKDYELESSEVLYYGTSTSTSGAVLAATITIPATTAPGDYLLRIGGADSAFDNEADLDPCYTGTWACFQDYTLRVIATGAYTITCATTTGGTITADKNNADENDVVTITATPETDYLLTALTYTPEGGSAQNIDITNMPYTFTMPAANVTVNATFWQPNCPKPTNLTVSNLAASHATVSWDSEAGNYTVKYSTATVDGTTLDPVFEDGFESGLGNWTTYANGFSGEGTTNWQTFDGSQFDDQTNHGGSYSAMSRSWTSSTGDVDVDNWLVSPQMTLGNTLKFWVTTNSGYPGSYAVYVSTGSGVVPSSGTGDFEVVANLTLATGSWVEQTYDLSAYAGQQGYVAIRHKDNAQDYFLVDDFGVYNTINTYSYGSWTTVNPNPTTESCQLTGLSAETLYAVQVQANCGGSDGSSAWSTIYFTTPDNCGAPQELASSNVTASSATLNWADDKDSYNLQYRKVYFHEGFESETMPTGWTTIDNNNDGLCWHIGSSTAHSGVNGVCNSSFVYSSDFSINTTPDDYLISPQLDLQGTLRVWLSGYPRSSSNYSEHFEILLSTTETSVSNFTTTLVTESTTTNSYVEYTADLSSYAGQKGYIAIRHFNCTDQNYLYVDDFGLYGSENWVALNPNPTTETANLTGLTPNTRYEWQVQGNDCSGIGTTSEWSAVATFTTLEGYIKTIQAVGAEAWAEGKGGYYLIASPLAADVDPATVTGMITDNLGANVDETTSTYDLYSFDQAETDEWRNYRTTSNFNLVNGQGYLYASKEGTELVFTGAANSNNTQDVTLSLTAAAPGLDFPDWNLVGNPFALDDAYITKSFYTLENCDTYTLNTAGTAIHPMQGLLVVADEDGETMTFSTEAPAVNNSKLNMNVSNERSVVDQAIISFTEGQELPKLQFRNGSTKVYMPKDGKEYAIVSTEAMGTMPVNFKAESNGSYTISFNTENVELGYLHLIDNMNGNDVDLLATPSYSFDAKTTDYESRFKLVFATGNSTDDTFAFYSNGSFVINNEGNATLQVIDINGRILKSESINGCANINVNAASGVYMIRLVNGDNVKVQKVVVR